MVAAKLLLLAGIIGIAYGQTFYYDIGTDIELDGTSILANRTTRRSICFTGSVFYFTFGSVIFERNNNVITQVIDAGVDIDSISCLCNVLVYSYRNASVTYVVYYNNEDNGISIRLDLGSNTDRVGLELTHAEGLVIVSRTTMWIYDLAPLSSTPQMYNYVSGTSSSLVNQPRCISSYDNGGELVVFASFGTDTNVEVITLNRATSSGGNATVTERSVQFNGQTGEAKVACLDIDNDRIYFLTLDDNEENWEVRSYAISLWISGSVGFNQGTQEEQGSSTDIRSNNNGLEVCGTGCPTSCDMATCSCSTTCGFCIGGDSTCQCEDSAQTGCIYQNATQEAQCVEPTPHFDSYCIVDLPLAKRRTGGPIRVIATAVSSATMSVRRLVQTGRWNVQTLPIRNVIQSVSSPFADGFEFPVQSSARGRRFGVYVAEIDPADAAFNSEGIPCIATENSGFYNKFYTYTRSVGQSVTLVATFNTRLQPLVSQVMWRFTGFNDVSSPLAFQPVPSCNGQLTCTISSLTTTNEGVYQAFRKEERYRRTWHPLFYLFVRGCADGRFGLLCNGVCPACEHGVCDDLTGLCTCQAGWTGTHCNNTCSAGFVGQSCGIACSDVVSGRSDCSGLSFCPPGKVGCSCYSGFDAPECMTACGAGTCGPSCTTNCAGGSCDARTCI